MIKTPGRYAPDPIEITFLRPFPADVGDVLDTVGIDGMPQLIRVTATIGRTGFACTPLGRWEAMRYRAARAVRRAVGRAWRWARWLAVLAVLPGCGLDVSAALASCASDLQCDPSELCSAGRCSLRCEGPQDCPEGDGCYLTYRERADSPEGYYATCAPEQDGLREAGQGGSA